MKAGAPPEGFGTRAIHAGQSPDPSTGAVMTPIFQVSTYAQQEVGKHQGYEYSRTDNPTRTALQGCLAALEGAAHGLCFASGLAATDTLVRTVVSPGEHVVCGDDVYGGTYRLFDKVLRPHGFQFSFVDFTKVPMEQAIPAGTKLVWLESPTNPLLKITDIRAVVARAHAVGAQVVVDNTFASPYFQNPLALGADFVLHSTTKYLGGHSDVVGGTVLTNHTAAYERLKFHQNAIGAVPGPMDCFLTLRGLKTLHVRMERHQQNARAIVDFLLNHPEVERVYYPLHESHPGYAVAKSQMSGFGGMISFELRGDLARARRFVAMTKIFTLAESLGGVESLIELPAAMTHASIEPEKRKAIGIVDGLIRLSVGIEDLPDLLADLEQAFEASRA
ncbi:MAG TPA: cystathionine gamma-synthase [Myxococcota bacterium]|nr:cystathionine gamma-synthase [Myxococcota bacterium]HND28662.1 cystathionine gamma-synthase [Myxococcota bacterium]HNH47948.1 cystathionine gamma-synthase [Myxococcota bacterium]